MKPSEAEAIAKEFLDGVDKLAAIVERSEQIIKDGFSDEAEVPLSHLRSLTRQQGEGVHQSIGLLMAALVALRYHRSQITSEEMDQARGQLMELALWVAQAERPPKRKHGVKGKPRSS